MMIISQEKKDTAPQDPRQSGCFENFEGNLKPRKGPKTDFQSRMKTFQHKVKSSQQSQYYPNYWSNKSKIT